MTNAELIEKLKRLPLDNEILIREESGYALLVRAPEVQRVDGEDAVVIG